MSKQRLTIILLFNLTLWLGAGWWSASQPAAPTIAKPTSTIAWPNFQVWPASSTLVWSPDKGILVSQDSRRLRPIASLSKMITALVVLNEKPNWQAHYKLKNEDERYGNISYIYPGEEISINDLWHLSLMASDNTATQALIRAVGLSDDDYRQKVKALAERLQIKDLTIDESTGLSTKNQASAEAIAIITREALSQEKVREVASLARYEIKTAKGRSQQVTNTDAFVRGAATLPQGWEIVGGKTGCIDEAGYCFAALWQDKQGQTVVSVILGAQAKETRFSLTKDLINYATKKYY